MGTGPYSKEVEKTYVLFASVDRKRVGSPMGGEEAMVVFDEVVRELLRTDLGQD